VRMRSMQRAQIAIALKPHIFSRDGDGKLADRVVASTGGHRDRLRRYAMYQPASRSPIARHPPRPEPGSSGFDFRRHRRLGEYANRIMGAYGPIVQYDCPIRGMRPEYDMIVIGAAPPA